MRVIGTWLGGGFGGKEDITLKASGTLATKTNARLLTLPARVLLAHSKGTLCYEIQDRGDQRRAHCSRKLNLLLIPALIPTRHPGVTYATVNAAGPYDIDNVKVDTHAVATNNPLVAPTGCAIQPNVAYESQIDELPVLGHGSVKIRQSTACGRVALCYRFYL